MGLLGVTMLFTEKWKNNGPVVRVVTLFIQTKTVVLTKFLLAEVAAIGVIGPNCLLALLSRGGDPLKDKVRSGFIATRGGVAVVCWGATVVGRGSAFLHPVIKER